MNSESRKEVSADLNIMNGQVVTEHGVFGASISVKNGKIWAIGGRSSLPRAKDELDVHGNFVLPGVIDTHVHIEGMGCSEREDFSTGSKAAASGGVTTYLEMPQSIPPVTTITAFEKKLQLMKANSFVDFGLYAGVGSTNLDAIDDFVKQGAIAFKTFMMVPAPSEKDSQGFNVTNDGSLIELFKQVGKTRLVLNIHAENDGIIKYLIKKLKREGVKGPRAHTLSRPPIAEVEAVSRAIMLARGTGARIHIVHISSKEAIELVRQAKLSGQQVTTEVCPHHLLMTAEDFNRIGILGKYDPPLRSTGDLEACWNAINDGTISSVVSDHAPYTREEKGIDLENIFDIASGAPGIETLLPVMLTQMNSERITLEKLVEVTSVNPAKLFGIYPRKGAIEIGSDADFVIVDLQRASEIREENLYTKQKMSVFNGWKIKGMPIATIVRGEIVMNEGEIVGERGYGRFICGDEKVGHE